MFRGTGRAINKNIFSNYEKGRKMMETLSFEEYDKKVRKTYKPQWRDSAQKASRVLDKL
jgi:hypothetical protein